MIGRDEKMLIVFEWIRTAAKSDISVLILGPTGSGKEVVARMIHELSRRGAGEVPGGQLRRAARHALRIGNLRLRERRVHRRPRSQARTPRAGERRHAVPRRNRRHVAHRAGQAAARARGAALRAARRAEIDLRRFPADLGDQPAARTVRPRRTVPRGSLLPRQRVRDPAAVAARAAGRHPGARRSASSRATARRRGCRSTARASRAKRSICSSLISGPATSASSKARSRARRCRRRAAAIRASDIEFLHATRRRRRRSAATACRRSPKPSARTSSACSKRCTGTRRKRRGCSTSAAARSTGKSSSTTSNPRRRSKSLYPVRRNAGQRRPQERQAGCSRNERNSLNPPRIVPAAPFNPDGWHCQQRTEQCGKGRLPCKPQQPAARARHKRHALA